MVKTYCDRCGKEIQGSKHAWMCHRTIYAIQRLIPSSIRNDWEETDKHICPDCEEQYIHWFVNPDNTQED